MKTRKGFHIHQKIYKLLIQKSKDLEIISIIKIEYTNIMGSYNGFKY